MKQIPLGCDRFAIVDDEDYPYINRFSWHLIIDQSGNSHAGTTIHGRRDIKAKRKDVTLYMENFLIKNDLFMVTTHKNRNMIDNRKENLISIKCFISRGRRRKSKGNYSSEYKGVYWRSREKTWRGKITCKGKKYEYNSKSENDVANWYNRKARELYGEYAYQNIIK